MTNTTTRDVKFSMEAFLSGDYDLDMIEWQGLCLVLFLSQQRLP